MDTKNKKYSILVKTKKSHQKNRDLYVTFSWCNQGLIGFCFGRWVLTKGVFRGGANRTQPFTSLDQ